MVCETEWGGGYKGNKRDSPDKQNHQDVYTVMAIATFWMNDKDNESIFYMSNPDRNISWHEYGWSIVTLLFLPHNIEHTLRGGQTRSQADNVIALEMHKSKK